MPVAVERAALDAAIGNPPMVRDVTVRHVIASATMGEGIGPTEGMGFRPDGVRRKNRKTAFWAIFAAILMSIRILWKSLAINAVLFSRLMTMMMTSI
jgi:hypothetical protein